MKKFLFITLLVSLISCLFSACEDDDFTSDSSYKLTLSKDTLSFDTLYTNYLSATKRIMVYNDTKENIRINEIRLVSSYDCFQVNVNGRSGNSFQDVELKAHDSMYVFVQVKIKELGQNAPLSILGSLVFSYNGNTQNVILSTCGQDVHLLKGATITEDTHWTNDKPYLIYDSLSITENAKLTIDAGTKLYFYTNAYLVVHGKLEVLGDEHYPVLFRGHRTDYIYDDVKYDKIVGQWGGIIFAKESYDNKLSGAIIRSSEFGIEIEESEMKEDVYKLTLANSCIHNTKGSALNAINAKVYAYNTEFSNSLNACLMLQGGDYLFNHCTIVNCPRNSRFNNAVMLLNTKYYTDEPIIPLVKADFNNCIIYGTNQQEVKFGSSNEDKGNEENLNYHFNSCLIKYANTDNSFAANPRFTNVTWTAVEPLLLFKKIDHTNYEYDYSLSPISPAINKANEEILTLYPECKTDKKGTDRMLDALPDLGAYEYISEIKK